MAGQARGAVIINVEECKGCGLCVESCPPECLELAAHLSPYGVHPARYTGEGCTGCGICFYCCPEPGAITVCRLAMKPPLSKQPSCVSQHMAAAASGCVPPLHPILGEERSPRTEHGVQEGPGGGG